jgi:hypothetical protein
MGSRCVRQKFSCNCPMAKNLRDAFLERASCFTATSSPSTSAHLMAEKLDSLATSHTTAGIMLKATCCLACGRLFIPGWTATTEQKATPSRTPVRERCGHVTKKITHACPSCHRKTTTVIQQPRKLEGPRKEKSDRLLPAKSAPPDTLLKEQSPSRSTAKQRAKERKSKQSLQALLSSRSKRKSGASSSSLDLMDFMKAS